MHVLFLSRWFPYPPDNGAKIRVSNLIKQLSLCHKVSLLSFASELASEQQLDTARQYCQHVTIVPYRPFQPRRFKAVMSFFAGKPRSVLDTYNTEMEKLVREIGRKAKPDIVIASEIDMAPYAMLLADVPRLLEDIELTVLHEQCTQQRHPIKKLRYRLTWWKASRYIADVLRAFDGCTVVSQQERVLLHQVSHDYEPIRITPNGVDVACYTANHETPRADSLIYSGSLTFSANYDAIGFFLKDVFPLIQAKRPDVKLSITGRLDGVPVGHLPHNEGVQFTGYLEDIRPMLAQSRASIVPLRIGGGTRVKILESLAVGTPVVATSKGAEGLDLIAGRDILIADTPIDFATAVLRLLEDNLLRSTLGYNGRRAVEDKYDWQIIGQGFGRFAEEIAGRGRHT